MNLCYNKISDINILEKVNFKKLKKLDLFNNEISDIKVLDRILLKDLEILNLGENNINKAENLLIIENLKYKIPILFF